MRLDLMEVLVMALAIFATMRAWLAWEEDYPSLGGALADIAFWTVVAALAWSLLR